MKYIEYSLYPLILVVSFSIVMLIGKIMLADGPGHGNPRTVAEQAIAAAYIKVDPATFNGHAYLSHYTINGVPGELSDLSLSFADNDAKAKQRAIDLLASRSIDGIAVKSLTVDADHADKGTVLVQASLHTLDGYTEPCDVVLSFVDGGLKPQSTHCTKTP